MKQIERIWWTDNQEKVPGKLEITDENKSSKIFYKYGVTKAAIKFEEHRKIIYRWRERFYYDKVFYTLEDLKNRAKYWIKEYNNFPRTV